jgi:putative Ca2+/H+ antiporter (TMEM165/GDT1 family)
MTKTSKSTEGILLNLLEKSSKMASKNIKDINNSNNQTTYILNNKQTNITLKTVKEQKVLNENTESNNNKNFYAEENFVKISKATTTIFLSGLFDKSFFITAFMAMKYSKLIVLFSTTLSLSLIGIISVYLGLTINQYFSTVWIDSFAVALFLIFGVHMIHEGFYMKEDEQTEVQILGRKNAGGDFLNSEKDEEKGFIANNSDDFNMENNSFIDTNNKICDCNVEKKSFKILKYKQQDQISESKNFKNNKCKIIDNNEVAPSMTYSSNYISNVGNNNTNKEDLNTPNKNPNDKNNNSPAGDLLNSVGNCEKTLNDKIHNISISEVSTVETSFCCEKSREFYCNIKNNSIRTLNKIGDKNHYNQIAVADLKENFNHNNYSNKYLNKCEKEGINNNQKKAKIQEIDSAKCLCDNSIQVFSKIFFLIFFSEIGDRSQISTIYLTTNFDKFSVIIAVVVSSTVLTVLAVFGGKLLANKISEKKLTIFAGWVFIVFGLIALYLVCFIGNLSKSIPVESSTASKPSIIINEMIIPNNINKLKQKIH